MRPTVTRMLAVTVALAAVCCGAQGCASGEGADPRATAVDRAIEDGTTHLLAQRTGDHWEGEQYFYSPDDPHAYGVTAYHVLLLEHLDREPESRDRAIRFLLETQGPDGDWGNPDANLAGVAALRQVDAERYSAAIESADDYIASHGQTLDDCLMHTQLYHALAGEYDWDRIMDPAALGVAPGADPASLEQWPEWAVDQFLAIQLLKAAQLPSLDDAADERVRDMVEYLLAQQQRDGCWMSTAAATNDIVLALHEVRRHIASAEQRARIDRAIDRGVRFLCDDRQLASGYVSLFDISVTETALALRALLECGTEPDDAAVREGADWLIRSKFPCGGWGFTPATAPHNDAEDSGFCMAVLSVTDPEYAARQAEFLIGEQSKDGGWAPFSKDLGPFSMSHYEYQDTDLSVHAPETYFIDPSVPEISAHALTGLGKVGYGPADAVVERAEEYFQAVQFEDGKWYSAWWTGYVYGTAAVLSSLGDVGADLDQPYVRAAREWLRAHQNPDGGWGDDPRAIRDPGWAGRGESTPMHTAVAIIALLDTGTPADSPEIVAGIDHLVATQGVGGGWTDDHQLAMYGDPYSNPVVSNAYALWALGAYRQRLESSR